MKKVCRSQIRPGRKNHLPGQNERNSTNYCMFIREQLTTDKLKAIYMLREGNRGATTEGRLNIQKIERVAVISSLLDLQSKLNGNSDRMRNCSKISNKRVNPTPH